ncbi:MAG: metallophosphoesterase [Terrimicrobiaceae bacterium]|nr:metallophosphoesterase [Terrimicrobiaceae bacterium]
MDAPAERTFDRLGPVLTKKRLALQEASAAHLLHQGEGLLRLERWIPLDRTILTLLALVGLAGPARREFLGIRLVEQTWTLAHLPAAFDGFRLLQLSDLHLDIDPELSPAIVRAVQNVPHDAAVVTGDFRNRTDGDPAPCIALLSDVLPFLAKDRWGILGNHDSLEMTQPIEAAGLPILLNESAALTRCDAKLWICGTDDPHFFRTHDLEAASRGIPSGDCKILLTHSPEIFDEAEQAGFDLQLSGHTHGGQLCLPGGFPLVVPCRAPRRFARGRWSHGRLQGYTSPGTGSCGVAARLFCPPEITLHTLRSPSAGV